MDSVVSYNTICIYDHEKVLYGIKKELMNTYTYTLLEAESFISCCTRLHARVRTCPREPETCCCTG